MKKLMSNSYNFTLHMSTMMRDSKFLKSAWLAYLVFFLLLFAYVLIMFTVERTKVRRLAQKDDAIIRMKYTTLKIKIKKALEKKVEKEDAIKEVIKEYIRDQFCDKDDTSKVLQKRDTISDVFDKLNEFKMWDYSTTDKLFTVAEVFLDDDEDIMADIEDLQKKFSWS